LWCTPKSKEKLFYQKETWIDVVVKLLYEKEKAPGNQEAVAKLEFQTEME